MWFSWFTTGRTDDCEFVVSINRQEGLLRCIHTENHAFRLLSGPQATRQAHAYRRPLQLVTIVAGEPYSVALHIPGPHLITILGRWEEPARHHCKQWQSRQHCKRYDRISLLAAITYSHDSRVTRLFSGPAWETCDSGKSIWWHCPTLICRPPRYHTYKITKKSNQKFWKKKKWWKLGMFFNQTCRSLSPLRCIWTKHRWPKHRLDCQRRKTLGESFCRAFQHCNMYPKDTGNHM